MKNIPQAYRPSYLWFWPPLILGGSVISAGTIHDLRRVKVPGTGPLWNPCQLYVCFHPIYQLWVFPPYLPVVSVSTLYTGCVCVFPPYIPAVCVPIFCFYQILTAFNKLKIMSEIPHNKWQLKRCHNYSHKMFQSRDSKLWAVTADSINTFINLNMKLIASLMLTSRVTM
jgi:hypothetical protein